MGNTYNHYLLQLIIFCQLFQDKKMGTAPMGMSRLSALTLMIMSGESPSEWAKSLGRSPLKVSKKIISSAMEI